MADLSSLDFSFPAQMLRQGVQEGAFPGAVLLVGDRTGELFRCVEGYRSLAPSPLPMEEDTRFDMASLTKLLSTTMITLRLLEQGCLSLNTPISDYWDCPDDKASITLKHLLTHTSGLHPSYHLEEGCSPADAVSSILHSPLVDKVGERVHYSCMGFILLGRTLERIAGKSLDVLFEQLVARPLGLVSTGYLPVSPSIDRGDNFAATEYRPELGRHLCGVVHDENARFLGGVSGNAGLFSTADDLSRFGRMLANRGEWEGSPFLSPAVFDMATANYTPFDPCEYRGIGFSLTDRRLYRSGTILSAGDLFTDGSYGHTGFTGTSLWVDRSSGLYVVLLTNRVHPTRENTRLMPFRRRLHNAIQAAYSRRAGRQSFQ